MYIVYEGFDISFGILILVSFLMECSCMASVTLVVMVVRGFTFHPLFCMVFISGLYVECLCLKAWLGNLS